MSVTSTHRTFHRRSYIPDYELYELFSDDELMLKLMVAKYRILMAFDHATFWSHGKMRGTDNFIIGVGARQKDLVEYVANRNGNIVTASELPDFVGDRSSVLRTIARNAEKRLLAVQLAMMCTDNAIWFNGSTPGLWEVAQHLMDDYRLNRQMVIEAKRVDARLRREALHAGGRLRVVH